MGVWSRGVWWDTIHIFVDVVDDGVGIGME